jgi:hypothetical protein
MSIVKLVPAWLHGVGDYGAGIALIVVALIRGGTDEAVLTGVVLGAVLLAVSLVTRYPLGAVKAVPFPVHSAGDYLGAALLILAPFALGFNDSDTGLSVFYIVVGAVVILLSLVTDYQDPRITIRESRHEPHHAELASASRGRTPVAHG